jgi:hypothetical protein
MGKRRFDPDRLVPVWVDDAVDTPPGTPPATRVGLFVSHGHFDAGRPWTSCGHAAVSRGV